jgi:hypothetical protein
MSIWSGLRLPEPLLGMALSRELEIAASIWLRVAEESGSQTSGVPGSIGKRSFAERTPTTVKGRWSSSIVLPMIDGSA